VSLSSTGHLFSPVVFDDLRFDFIPYTPIVAYGQSKTANALLAVGITQRWSGDVIRSNTLHPRAMSTRLPRAAPVARPLPSRKRRPPSSIRRFSPPPMPRVSSPARSCNRAHGARAGRVGFAATSNAERMGPLSPADRVTLENHHVRPKIGFVGLGDQGAPNGERSLTPASNSTSGHGGAQSFGYIESEVPPPPTSVLGGHG
jgi:NAD(P)-dependent dehydrogenase (short-subunit alcohol dehydrogenase family)